MSLLPERRKWRSKRRNPNGEKWAGDGDTERHRHGDRGSEGQIYHCPLSVFLEVSESSYKSHPL
jgi:hypothetical protein